jgi:hypothetical protein
MIFFSLLVTGGPAIVQAVGVSNNNDWMRDSLDDTFSTLSRSHQFVNDRMIQDAIPSECQAVSDAALACYEAQGYLCGNDPDSALCAYLYTCIECADVFDSPATLEEEMQQSCSYSACCQICRVEDYAQFSCLFESFVGCYSCTGGCDGSNEGSSSTNEGSSSSNEGSSISKATPCTLFFGEILIMFAVFFSFLFFLLY